MAQGRPERGPGKCGTRAGTLLAKVSSNWCYLSGKQLDKFKMLETHCPIVSSKQCPRHPVSENQNTEGATKK